MDDSGTARVATPATKDAQRVRRSSPAPARAAELTGMDTSGGFLVALAPASTQ